MCSFCREGRELADRSIAEYVIQDNKLVIDYMAHSSDSSFEEEIEIKFCPMCGQELY